MITKIGVFYDIKKKNKREVIYVLYHCFERSLSYFYRLILMYLISSLNTSGPSATRHHTKKPLRRSFATAQTIQKRFKKSGF